MPARYRFRLPSISSLAQLRPSRFTPSSALNSTRQHSNAGKSVQSRAFPTTGFEVIPPGQLIEEERLPFYRIEDYYPVRLGEVIHDRYQIVAKLGYGTSSTVWLSRDLRDQKYWVLKVHINTLKENQELNVYQHLAHVNIEHRGKDHIRRLTNSFELQGPHGMHDVFVMPPMGMSLRTFQEMQKEQVFHQSLVTAGISQVLLGLNYLHEANVVHTDLHSDNVLIALTNDAILSKVEENEINTPSPRKRIGDTILYVSQYVLGGAGPLTICDFGQARIGTQHRGSAMPLPYRAPEVILDMEWGKSIDSWSVGLLAWDLLEKESLFGVYNMESLELNDAHHLAAMTALLGPPPPEFLKKSEETKKYWTEDGQWKGPVPLPPERSFESLARALQGEDREWFLNFVECFIAWLPEHRLDLPRAYFHPWLKNKKPDLE